MDRICRGFDRGVESLRTPPRSILDNRNKPQGAVVDGEIKHVSLEDYKGKWTVVFFYPKARDECHML